VLRVSSSAGSQVARGDVLFELVPESPEAAHPGPGVPGREGRS